MSRTDQNGAMPDHEESAGAECCRGRVIPAGTVLMSDEPAWIGMPPGDASAEPQVEVVQEGGVVRAIEVTCTCGRKIRVHCVY